MSLNTRIKERREQLKLTRSELAEKIGVTPSAIANYENAISSPKIELMFRLFDALECDANYLYQDEMKELTYKDRATPEEFENIVKKYRALDDCGREHVNAVLSWESDRIHQLQKTKTAQSSATLRIYTYMHKIAAAGNGYYFDDIPTDTIEAPYKEGADFIIGVSGDSMEPVYSNGDLVYVQKCQVVNTGDIGIFMVNGECYIKKAGEEGLVSLNKKYPLMPGTDTIQCIGKVLGKVIQD